MNLVINNSSHNIAPKLTYDVLIENQQDGTVKATLLGLPDCQGLGTTETEAIEKLSQSLQNRLETAKIVTLEIETPQAEHPWLKFAGMHKDNPLVDEVITYIEEERNELDSQMEECHAKFINDIEKELEEMGITDADDIMNLFYLTQRNQSISINDPENNL
jgi:predicted RNase H-like HicB family nuclease